MRNKYLIVIISLMPLVVSAQAEEPKKSQNFVVKGLMWVKTLIDSMAVANVDRSYIEQPKRPWAVELRTEAGQSTLKMEADWTVADVVSGGFITRTDNGFSTSAGLWAGYRGYGFGLSKELTGGDGSTISFGAMGGSFGINLRINSYRSKQPEIETTFSDVGGQNVKERVDIDDPIRVRSLFLDGYYMFNGKHFSYAAAYDQSLIQRKSAGSIAVGLMYYHSRMSYEQDSNWPLVLLMRDVGKLKFTQANVGLGYAYNWVPARGWLVSAMVMPMVTFYNKMQTYYYRIVDENGVSILDMIANDPDWINTADNTKWRVLDNDCEETTNRMSWNFNGRLSVSYNWSRWYLRVFGHYNRFTYKNESDNGRLTDWTAYASLGYRF